MSYNLPLLLQAYMFREYWEDIGTIKSFYDANLALTEEVDFIVFIEATFHNSIPSVHFLEDVKHLDMSYTKGSRHPPKKQKQKQKGK